MTPDRHTTVLAQEAIDALNLDTDAVVVDATLGAGGHTAHILTTLNESGVLLAIDADKRAVEAAREQWGDTNATTYFVTANFRSLRHTLAEHSIACADAVLADLGWRSEQFSGSDVGGQKGFSFMQDEPLLMTFGDPETYPFTARDIVNEWSAEAIRNVLKGYGEERHARRIADHIVSARNVTPITTSRELAEVVVSAIPRRAHSARIHPATRTFQALRIAVNDELAALEEFLEAALAALCPGGRLAVISFHSLEDRIVKHAFVAAAREGTHTILTKKPITPSPEEIDTNPRARSAKMRVIESHYEEKTDNNFTH